MEWVALFQGMFPTKGLNPGLLYCRQILYHLSPKHWSKFLSWGAPGSKSMVRADASGTEYEIGLHFLHTWVSKILDNPCYDTQQQSLFNGVKWWRGCSGRKKLNCGMKSRIKWLSLRGLLSFPLYVFLYPILDSSFPGTPSLLTPVLTTLGCFFSPFQYYLVRFFFSFFFLFLFLFFFCFDIGLSKQFNVLGFGVRTEI